MQKNWKIIDKTVQSSFCLVGKMIKNDKTEIGRVLVALGCQSVRTYDFQHLVYG